MKDTLQDLMREATRLTQAGRLDEATAAIQQALAGVGAVQARRAAAGADDLNVLDGCVFEVDQRPAAIGSGSVGREREARPAQRPMPAGPGEFVSGSHRQGARVHGYKLYVPPGRADGGSLPLVVMLHGCTQDPDDFAAGTGMNEAAREQGFFVLYPQQAQGANPQRCWNWFNPGDQKRDLGEPAWIAALTQSVIEDHRIDTRRVFIAGLSAGGAMAAIVAAAYPELFAAVGVHSGLACGSASNVSEALAAMKKGASGAASTPVGRPVPTIVFHGDQDQTVHPRNGEQVVEAVLGRRNSRRPSRAAAAAPSARVEQGASAGGRRYTRSVHPTEAGGVAAEHWLVHGAGHAWSGGRSAGSYTDASGPDATQEMLRFFWEHPLDLKH